MQEMLPCGKLESSAPFLGCFLTIHTVSAATDIAFYRIGLIAWKSLKQIKKQRPVQILTNNNHLLFAQVLKMTMRGGFHSRRRNEMVGWLVTCATEIGLVALVSIIKVTIDV